jgi:hypothetical protein
MYVNTTDTHTLSRTHKNTSDLSQARRSRNSRNRQRGSHCVSDRMSLSLIVSLQALAACRISQKSKLLTAFLRISILVHAAMMIRFDFIFGV